jgi:hypothetical protein
MTEDVPSDRSSDFLVNDNDDFYQLMKYNPEELEDEDHNLSLD